MSRITYDDGRPEIEEGYPFAFTVEFEDGIDPRYSVARFEMRAERDPSLAELLVATQGAGITIDYDEGEAHISFGGDDTADLGIDVKCKVVYGELQLIDPDNTQDRIGTGGFEIAVVPGVIDHG
jgi:hypothetical protein